MIMLSHPRHARRALQAVARLLVRWARMRSAYRLPPFSFRRALPPPPRKWGWARYRRYSEGASCGRVRAGNRTRSRCGTDLTGRTLSPP